MAWPGNILKQKHWLAPFGGVEHTVQGLRLRTLVRLRWLAVVGQTGAILWVYLVLGFPLPLGACLAIIALSAWLNVFLSLRWRTSIRLNEHYAGALLAYDLIQLAVLLYLTGGLQNPFSFLFLVPVTVSAASLPLERTIWLCAIALISVTVLAVRHMPLPWGSVDELILPPIYISGVWAALCCGLIFSALYVSRVAKEAREMSEALSATEEILAREQKLHALDGLAAAAAHELGTPLATISLVAKELERDHKTDGAIREDLELLVSQADRCREILSKLANRDAQSDEMYAKLEVLVMIDEIAEPLRGPDVDIEITAPSKSAGDSGEQPVFARNPAIIYGLGNLLENAVDFAAKTVRIEVTWDPSDVVITIEDDGPGFSQDVIDRLGEPFVTTRPGYGGAALSAETAGTHHGMGLGFFIAQTVLERSGASVALANRASPETGAIVRVAWPRASITVPPMASRA